MAKKKAGSELRDRVAGILRRRFRNVDVEQKVGTTTADIVFVDDSNTNFPWKIAIECKDWTASLNSSDLAEIYQLYFPALKNDEIDALWIISNRELGQSPSHSASLLPNVKHSTFEEFMSSMMNFSELLEDNHISFANHDSSKNFLHLNVRNSSETVETMLRQWMEEQDQPALLVYGGYGLGKTSFSLYISSILTQEYKDGGFPHVNLGAKWGQLTESDWTTFSC